MTWVRVDDQFFFKPRIRQAGRDGRALFLAGLCYCAANLTDGIIVKPSLPFVAAMAEVEPNVADLLVTIGLWEDHGDSYLVVDYLTYQQSREQVVADREIARRRSAMNADPELRKALQTRDGNRCRYCGKQVNWRDRKSPGGATYDHVIPVVAGGTETLENLVVACRGCNVRKGSRTLDEAGMTLLPNGTEPGSSRNQGNNQNTRPRPLISDPVLSSSLATHEPTADPVDDDELSTVPADTWTHYADLKLETELRRKPGSVDNQRKWKASVARNAKTEHAATAQRWWTMFELTPRRLAECLIDNRAPRNTQRREAS